eukprot:363560-Chlamydomonas_euryale.AAC.21
MPGARSPVPAFLAPTVHTFSNHFIPRMFHALQPPTVVCKKSRAEEARSTKPLTRSAVHQHNLALALHLRDSPAAAVLRADAMAAGRDTKCMGGGKLVCSGSQVYVRLTLVWATHKCVGGCQCAGDTCTGGGRAPRLASGEAPDSKG